MMNLAKTILASLFLAWFAVGSALAAPEIVIIVNPAANISTPTQDEVARLYLGKTKTIGGERLAPIDLSKNSDVAEHFHHLVMKKTTSQLRAYWSKLVFTGKGSPPKTFDSDAEVVAAVAGNPGLIGYVQAAAVDDSVKVLMTVE